MSKSESNPYINRMENGFCERKFKLASTRILKLPSILSLLFCVNMDLYVLNWPENIIFRRFKYVYAVIYLFVIYVRRILKMNTVWILHNKRPHSKTGKLANYIMNATANCCKLIVVHSEDGLNYAVKRFKNKNIKVFLHPAYENRILRNDGQPIYDILIWGSMSRYKGLYEFLDYASTCDGFRNKRIAIVGKEKEEGYLESLKNIVQKSGLYVEFKNDFILEKELNLIIGLAKCVLFLHHDTSVISSGAAVYSINKARRVIGPPFANFVELQKMGLVNTFTCYADILKIMNSPEIEHKCICNYLSLYTWEKLADCIVNEIR